jgi:hypothetical protein
VYNASSLTLCQFWGSHFSFTLKEYQLPKDTIKALSYHHGATKLLLRYPGPVAL